MASSAPGWRACSATTRHGAARRGGYVETNDAGVILERNPDTVRGPDLAYFANEPSEEELEGYSQTLPLLVVEILSPEDRADRVMRKAADYQKSGIAWLWIIDPINQTVTVYRKPAVPVILEADEELTGEKVLPGFRCKVADLLPKTGSSGKRGKGK